jgi:DNA repair protein RadD
MHPPIWTPRFYQNEATASFWNSLMIDPNNMPLIGMPTGSGKSGVIGMICHEGLRRFPGMRITVSTTSKELVAQDAAALLKVWPQAPFGIFSAGLKSKQAAMPITLTTVQSAVKAYKEFGRQNLVIVDEAQDVAPEDETNYGRFFDGLREENPLLRVGGLSATLFRKKKGLLVENGGIFNTVCYDITGRRAFEVLVNMGYLVPVRAHPMNFTYDVSGVKTTGGDYNENQLQKVVNDGDKTERALQEALQRGAAYKHWLIFCVGIEHIETTAAILSAWGETCTYVHSKMSGTERDLRIAAFKRGEYRMMINDGILTTGFDDPKIDHIVILRPSKSPVLHVQILGRGTRPDYAPGFDLDTLEGRLEAILASGKPFCYVSDFGGNLERMGPINDPVIPGRKTKKGTMPIKVCKTDKLVRPEAQGCGCYNFAAARRCEECGEEFIFDDEPKLEKKASTAVATAMSTPECYWFAVNRVEYEPHTRPFTPPAMKVAYFSGLNRYSQLVSVESAAGFAKHRARNWWRARGVEPPEMTHEGFQIVDTLPIPRWVLVQVNLTYPRVIQESFELEKPLLYNEKEPA